jgi:hypothetical protein
MQDARDLISNNIDILFLIVISYTNLDKDNICTVYYFVFNCNKLNESG